MSRPQDPSAPKPPAADESSSSSSSSSSPPASTTPITDLLQHTIDDTRETPLSLASPNDAAAREDQPLRLIEDVTTLDSAELHSVKDLVAATPYEEEDEDAVTSPLLANLPVLSQRPPPVPSARPSGLPVPPGLPYRVAEPSAQLIVGVPGVNPFQTPKRPRPVIGPTLSVFGALLWAFVVAGQFTTSWGMGSPLNQGVAVAMVMIATLVAFVMSIRRSQIVVPAQSTPRLLGRAIGIGALTMIFFVFCLGVATAVGSTSSRGHDLPIAFVLVVLSGLAAILGPRMTSPARPERSPRQKFALITMWFAGVLLTLVAGVDLAANG